MKITKQYMDALNANMLINGDCIFEMQNMEADIYDSCVIDPPYGIGFLQKKWDNFSPSSLADKTADHQNIDHKLQSARSASMHAGLYDLSIEGARNFEKWCFIWAKEALRVMKPGGHICAFGSTRMFHRMVVAFEEAGWEIRDTLSYNFANGFPKSHCVALDIDKKFGIENRGHAIAVGNKFHPTTGKPRPAGKRLGKYVPKTSYSQGWEGFGTGLKPGMELICLARKPLSEETVADNVLKWGTGGINIDGCRIPLDEKEFSKPNMYDADGRWPVNTIFSEEAAEILHSQREGIPHFYYCPKPDNAEKNMGLEGMPKRRRDGKADDSKNVMSKKMSLPQQNTHPTIKSVSLLQYLCRLITPPNGVVLDCFMGSGSCGIACKREGFRYIGIELEKEYFEIAKLRMAAENLAA